MNDTRLNTKLSLADAMGKIQYNMTNDYMFRAVLQKNRVVLTGLVASLLHMDPKTLDVKITNPIVLGEFIGDKDFILDIHVIVNGQMRLNLEMQVVNYGNWKERSLSYLCRAFDSLSKGSDYIEAAPAVHIGFLDFSLFEDAPEFYATYMMENIKNHRIYTDKIRLSVVELNSIGLATEEDCRYQIDQWAKLFKARTWEELKIMAMTNRYMESAVNTMYELSVDERVQEQCRRRAEYDYYLAKYQQEAVMYKELIAGKDAEIADKDAEIAELKRRLAEFKEKDQP